MKAWIDDGTIWWINGNGDYKEWAFLDFGDRHPDTYRDYKGVDDPHWMILE